MRWRKTTWALIVWTAVFGLWAASGIGALGESCAGLTGDDRSICEAGTAIGGGIGLTLIAGLWFVGFVVLAIIWFMTRPRETVEVYGPNGQHVLVTEVEARRRVRDGWTYQPGVPVIDPPADDISWTAVVVLIVVMVVGGLIAIGAVVGDRAT